MYTELFKFIGTTSLGYIKGKIYLLEIAPHYETTNAPSIYRPTLVPYDSWEKFLENWERI